MDSQSAVDNLDDYGQLFILAGEIAREPDLDGLLQQILSKSKPWMGAEACSIFLPDPATQELVIHSAQGESAPQLSQLRIPAGSGIVGIAMAEKRIIRVDDVSKDSRFYAKVDKDSGFTTRCLIASPLMDGQNCIGVIEYINAINRPCFNAHDERLVAYFSWLVSASLVRIRSHQASIERAFVQRDLDLARDMQNGLLPISFPRPTPENRMDLHARLIPAYEVSGDLYDFFPAPDGKQFFLVGDVSGKGVAAGLFMAVTRTLVRAEARQRLSPVEILTEVNNQLVPENSALLFVTMILGLYDPESGMISYAQGGHNPAVLLKADGTASYEPTGGQPLGVFAEANFAPYSVQLQPGDTFILYSDGITEAMNDRDLPYGEDRFLALLSNRQDLAARDLNQLVTRDVKSFTNGAEQSDDITLMTLKRL
jgi:phosphoserine phosphatase RsbU/P